MTELEKVKELIDKSDKIAALVGIQAELEQGLNGVGAEHLAYEIEEKYGYSTDEIITPSFLSKRVEIFYDYYKDIVLNKDNLQPSGTHKAMVRLEEKGKLLGLTTRSVYNLFERAGLKNIISLHGGVEHNTCPRCNREYGSAYIMDSRGVPVCEDCQTILRPGFQLYGEMIDNGKMTACANYIAKADILLVVGASLNSPLCRYMTQYYTGDKLIVVTNNPSLGDEKANYLLKGNCSEIMEQIISE